MRARKIDAVTRRIVTAGYEVFVVQGDYRRKSPLTQLESLVRSRCCTNIAMFGIGLRDEPLLQDVYDKLAQLHQSGV